MRRNDRISGIYCSTINEVHEIYSDARVWFNGRTRDFQSFSGSSILPTRSRIYMKLLKLSDVPKTLAHDSVIRQRFIAPGDLRSDIQTVNFVELKKGEGFTPHSHPDCEECFFIIEGNANAKISKKELNVKKGDFLIVEVGEMHTITNNSDEIFRYLQFRVLI